MFHKVRPLFEMARRECKKTERNNHQSVDEVMVPYKGEKARTLRQYVKNNGHTLRENIGPSLHPKESVGKSYNFQCYV